MSLNIRQLYDDLAYFYPITCVDAVVGGSISAGLTPEVVDLSSYISGNFSGIFKLYIYDNILRIFVADITVNEGFNISPDSNNVITTGIPVVYYPQESLVFKTITDDNTCKANVLLDTDGMLKFHIVPRTEITTDSDGNIIKNKMIDITEIHANAIEIFTNTK